MAFNLGGAAQYLNTASKQIQSLKESARKEDLHPLKMEQAAANIEATKTRTAHNQEVLRQLQDSREYNKVIKEVEARKGQTFLKMMDDNPELAMGALKAQYESTINKTDIERQTREDDLVVKNLTGIVNAYNKGDTATADSILQSFTREYSELTKSEYGQEHGIDLSSGVTKQNINKLKHRLGMANGSLLYNKDMQLENMKQANRLQLAQYKASMKNTMKTSGSPTKVETTYVGSFVEDDTMFDKLDTNEKLQVSYYVSSMAKNMAKQRGGDMAIYVPDAIETAKQYIKTIPTAPAEIFGLEIPFTAGEDTTFTPPSLNNKTTDSSVEVQQRFTADPDMRTYTLGEQQADGTYEVFDDDNNLIGYYE